MTAEGDRFLAQGALNRRLCDRAGRGRTPGWGRWHQRGADGSACDWGRVAAWQPPSKVVLLWQIGANWQFDPDLEPKSR
jgi:hypothetical protein